MDTFRFRQTAEIRKLFDDYLVRRYADIRFNIILAQVSDTLKAAARYRERFELPPTLRLVTHLFPKAKRAYLIASPLDPEYLPNLRKDIEAARGNHPELESIPLENSAFDEVERTLSASGEGAFALLLPGEWWLPSGEYLGGRTALDRLQTAAPMPYFGTMRSSN